VRSLVGLVLVAAGGCVYPATEPTGIELSWRLVEHNEVDGPEAVRVRSCEGALTEQLAFEIADVDEPQRHGVFRFDCATGYQTAVELQTSASDAFVRLDPGAYALGVLAIDDAANAQIFERVEDREVEVEDRGVTVEILPLQRAPVTWILELHGADACESLTLALVYAEPELDLPDHDPAEDAPRYRTALTSDRELGVGGQATACSATLDGVHRFEGIDRGVYLLELEVDGRTCAVQVDLGGRDGASSVIDLASLPCAG
jgi:hypothetical protein